MRKEGLKLEGSGDSLEGGGMARDRVERVYRRGAVTLGQAHQMGLRPATVIQLQGQAVPPPPPADPSLPHSPSAELQCCPGWRQKDRECTIRE